jgi:hypothetical protein
MGEQAAGAWRARPVAALLVRTAIATIPVAAAFLAGVVVTVLWPRPDGFTGQLAWWTCGVAAAGGASYLAARSARRLLPLAMLLKLSLTFPDRTPSRFSVALRAGGISDLRATRDRLGDIDVPLGEAAAEALVLATALTRHDRATRGHSERVRALTEVLAVELGLTTDERDRLRWAGLLHDVGKVAVPASILNKPGPLTEDEWAVMRTHPVESERLAAPLRPWLGEWTDAIGQHHERFDGTGYPNGLSGTDINLGARIVAVADTFEVMTSARAYKRPLPANAARQEISTHAGDLFDPDVARALLNVSLGKLRWRTGPLAWVATSPLLFNLRARAASLGNVAPTAASAVSGGVLAAVLAVGPAGPAPAAPPLRTAVPRSAPPVLPSAASPWPQRAAVATVPAAAAPPLQTTAAAQAPVAKAPVSAPAAAAVLPQPPRPSPAADPVPVRPPAQTNKVADEGPLVEVSIELSPAPPQVAVGAAADLPLVPVKVDVATGVGPNACTGVALNGLVLGCERDGSG